MSNNKSHRYKKQQVPYDPSYFGKYPSITINKYWIPKSYLDAVHLSVDLFRSGISFNKSLDQAHAVYPQTNRNKLAEHTLKYIANDY